MAASSETDCPLTNLVFDLRNHNEQTQKHLKSAADFVLKHAFDKPITKNPSTNPSTDPLTLAEFPISYMVLGKTSFASFMAAKLLALNMLHLEDAITMFGTTKDLLEMSDQDLNSMIEVVLELKEQRNKEDKKPTYPKGTGMSGDIYWTVMEAKPYAPKDVDSTSDLCRIDTCMEELMDTTVFTLPYCQHQFHTHCIERRVAENPLCPICQNWALPLLAEYPNWIKDFRKVREFLNRGSSASVSVLHTLMAVHLEELGLRNVLKHFRKQIHTIMEDEKEISINENDMIKKEVVEFLKDCRYIEEGRLVKRFHFFMERMFRALWLDLVYQNEFWKMVREMNVDQLKNLDSIRKLSRFVQAVEYVQRGI